MSICEAGGELGILSSLFSHSHLELIAVNLDDPQGPKYLSQVGSLIAEKKQFSGRFSQTAGGTALGHLLPAGPYR